MVDTSKNYKCFATERLPFEGEDLLANVMISEHDLNSVDAFSTTNPHNISVFSGGHAVEASLEAQKEEESTHALNHVADTVTDRVLENFQAEFKRSMNPFSHSYEENPYVQASKEKFEARIANPANQDTLETVESARIDKPSAFATDDSGRIFFTEDERLAHQEATGTCSVGISYEEAFNKADAGEPILTMREQIMNMGPIDLDNLDSSNFRHESLSEKYGVAGTNVNITTPTNTVDLVG